MLEIDGSQGEGGGQILRSSLALSMLTGRAIRLENIRAGRKKPGLKRQHLTALRAAAEISGAAVQGAKLQSQEVWFSPGRVRPGDFRFSVGTAGSATLVLQTVLPPLLLADGPSTLRVEGGTHNRWAPPYDFLAKAYLPLVERCGPRVDVRLERYGFFPAGGGEIAVRVEPVAALRPFSLLERGRLRGHRCRALVANIPRSIAEREIKTLIRKLGWRKERMFVEEVPSKGPGNVILCELESDELTEVFVGFGEKGRPAEKVATGLSKELRRHLDAGVPVGEHLADQLVLLLGIAGGGEFRTLAPTPHTRTNIAVIERFLPVKIRCEEEDSGAWRLSVAPTGAPDQ